jgi:hypothetical protein
VNKLRLDLTTLEVERLDVAVVSLNGGLETFGMGYASTELGQCCEGAYGGGTCACGGSERGASCNETGCDCDE